MDDFATRKAAESGRVAGDPDVVKKLGIGRRSRSRRWVRWLVAFVAALTVSAGVWFWRTKIAATKAPSYVTAAVERGDLRETVTATGTLSPLDSVEVGAEVTGRVTKVNVDVNDRVTKDQVLVEIDPEGLQARVDESQAQLQSAQASQRNSSATVKEAESKAVRAREMHARGLISDQDLETAEATLDRAKASVSTSAAQTTVAVAGLRSAKTSLGKAIIRSPIDGIVLARTVEVGQTLTAGFQTPVLFTLARDLTLMQLKIDVDEADVGTVHEGLEATFVVDAFSKRVFHSKLLLLGNLPKASTTVVTYEATLSVDNPDRILKPGMTATATIVTNEAKDVLSVPTAALRFTPPTAASAQKPTPGLPVPGLGGPMRGMGGGQRRGGGGGARPAGSAGAPTPRASRQKVYVVKGGALVPVVVEAGATDGRRTEIKGPGITAGMQVVVDVAEASP
jgi:HlyD family secretion protein